MIKKKKRIVPRYEEGNPGFFKKLGNSVKKFGKDIADKFKNVNATDVVGGISGAASGVANTLGIEQGQNAQIANAVGDVVGLIPGVGQIAGPIIKTLGSFAGESGRVDQTTGEITESSGFTDWFGWGKSGASLARESNRIKNTNVARELTQNLQADYANNPNVEVQPNVLAAEGGIMRRPVDALVSKGELIYDPTTKKLMKVPGSNGKPNKKDDVPIRLYEGDVVLSNSPTMLMANGKTPAQNVEKFINKKSKSSDGTIKAREAIIKKVVNWQEANKTQPQQYAMYGNGEDNVEVVHDDPKQDIQPVTKTRIGNVDEYGNIITSDGTRVPTTQTTVVKPVSTSNKTTSEKEMRITPRKPTERPFAGAKYVAMTDDRAKRYSDPEFVKHLNSYLGFKENVDLAYEQLKDLPQVKSAMRMYNNDKQKALKHLTSDNKYGNVMHYFYNDYINRNNKMDINVKSILPQVAKIEKGALPKLNIKLPPPIKDGDNSTKKTNWSDLAYKAASILTPALDRETADAVNYQVPVAKYRPTYVNVDPQLNAINDAYAMARYNQANISTNTGAGMAYGLQAASNRAKQMSDVYNWQTNAQNELIGKNVDTYNQWSQNYAGIMNNVYDKAAANEATARNINRQNRATALKNWGQILRDDKQFNMNAMKLQMAKPMFEHGYKDYDQFLKWMEENGYGKQVR